MRSGPSKGAIDHSRAAVRMALRVRFLTGIGLHTSSRLETLSTCLHAQHLFAVRYRDRAVPKILKRDRSIQQPCFAIDKRSFATRRNDGT